MSLSFGQVVLRGRQQIIKSHNTSVSHRSISTHLVGGRSILAYSSRIAPMGSRRAFVVKDGGSQVSYVVTYCTSLFNEIQSVIFSPASLHTFIFPYFFCFNSFVSYAFILHFNFKDKFFNRCVRRSWYPNHDWRLIWSHMYFGSSPISLTSWPFLYFLVPLSCYFCFCSIIIVTPDLVLGMRKIWAHWCKPIRTGPIGWENSIQIFFEN